LRIDLSFAHSLWFKYQDTKNNSDAHAIFCPKGLGILILNPSSGIKMNQQKKPLRALRALAVQPENARYSLCKI